LITHFFPSFSCAFSNTPKYNQVRGKGKIVGKDWIEDCFKEQKNLPWRRYALSRSDKDGDESEAEIHNVLSKPPSATEAAKEKSVEKRKASDSDDDMVVVDRRLTNGNGSQAKEDEDEKPMEVDEPIEVNEKPMEVKSLADVTTDEEPMALQDNSMDATQAEAENKVYNGKTFYLNKDLPATDVIKLKNQIKLMMGTIIEKSSRAHFVISKYGNHLPTDATGEILKDRWVYECYDMECFIPTIRYKLSSTK